MHEIYLDMHNIYLDMHNILLDMHNLCLHMFYLVCFCIKNKVVMTKAGRFPKKVLPTTNLKGVKI